MADQFLPSLQNFKQHSFSLSDIDPNIEFPNHFQGIIPSHQENPALNLQSLMGFSNDHNLFPQLPEFPGNLENFQGLFFQEDNKTLVPSLTQNIITNHINDHRERKRKSIQIRTPETSSANSSPQGSDNGIRKKNSLERAKRVKGNGKEEENLREVVHVRAKRGQATDSHSLAERVRRGKINERLRCLQDIVPGCYKTMGMAVMLDEIINYVQSLQNQVEFLSMKLTAASSFHDFNSDTDVIDDTMQRAKTLEALIKTENAAIQGLPSAHQFAPLDLNFGYFPHNN